MRAALAPLAIFAVALVARAATAAGIGFPIPEDSAYYVAAARNLAEGRGLVTDVLWSYATPPLAVPRPAFDLWQPLASLIAAPVMAVFGPSLATAQVTSILLGALAAPLGWAIGRDAASEIGLPPGRAAGVAVAAGLGVALTPLLVVQGAEPDSGAPFTLLALAAAWLVPRALAEHAPGWRLRVGLGLALGLAYLARQEAVYLLLAYLGLAWLADRRARLVRTLPALVSGGIVVAPWLLRQATTWSGSPLSQLLENAWFVRPEDVFAWSERPSLAGHLAIGLPGLIGLRLDALVGNLGLLLVLAFPVGLLGLLAKGAWPRLLVLPSLRPLVVAGVLIVVVDTLVFPVASRAGLFLHGAGPVVAWLAVAAALGLDRLVQRVGEWRHWGRPNVVLAPLLILMLAAPVTTLAASLEQRRAAELEASYAELSAVASDWGLPPGVPVVSDHPMWAAYVLGRPALAKPGQGAASVADLARYFGAGAVVVGQDEEASVARLLDYRDEAGRACFRALAAPEAFRALAFACPTAGMDPQPARPILTAR